MKSIIFLDSKSAIQAVNEPKDFNCELIFDTNHKFDKKILNNRNIKVVWLKDHSDIEGNNKADYLAKTVNCSSLISVNLALKDTNLKTLTVNSYRHFTQYFLS